MQSRIFSILRRNTKNEDMNYLTEMPEGSKVTISSLKGKIKIRCEYKDPLTGGRTYCEWEHDKDSLKSRAFFNPETEILNPVFEMLQRVGMEAGK